MIEFGIGDSSETIEEKAGGEEEARREKERLELVERWVDDDCIEDASAGVSMSDTNAAIALAMYEALYREEAKEEKEYIS